MRIDRSLEKCKYMLKKCCENLENKFRLDLFVVDLYSILIQYSNIIY